MKTKNGLKNSKDENIIPPISKKVLIDEIKKSLLLGKTRDNFSLHLTYFKYSPNIVKEISRLREVTFRLVGEGTGKSCDFDKYDEYYIHLLLWDNDNNEIAGSYRLGYGSEIIENYGISGFYNYSTNILTNDFLPFLNNSLEMGRSFIQDKYWKSNALDYLWQGIGLFIQLKGNIRYLWGSVSISDNYPNHLKNQIIYYYKKWYYKNSHLAIPKNEFILSTSVVDNLKNIFNSNNHIDDFKILKSNLNKENFSVPVLLRKYTEITENEGISVINVNIDKDFSNCVDVFIMIDLNYIKETYIERYYKQKSFVKNN